MLYFDLFTSLDTSFGLKGQLILAPGNAWGKGNKGKTVRANMIFIKEKLIRTEFLVFIFRLSETLPFVRNIICSFLILIARTILSPVFQPRATLLRRLPWARLYWPFRSKKILCK